MANLTNSAVIDRAKELKLAFSCLVKKYSNMIVKKIVLISVFSFSYLLLKAEIGESIVPTRWDLCWHLVRWGRYYWLARVRKRPRMFVFSLFAFSTFMKSWMLYLGNRSYSYTLCGCRGFIYVYFLQTIYICHLRRTNVWKKNQWNILNGFQYKIKHLYFYMPRMNVNYYYRDICNRPEQIEKFELLVTNNTKSQQLSQILRSLI